MPLLKLKGGKEERAAILVTVVRPLCLPASGSILGRKQSEKSSLRMPYKSCHYE